MQQNAAPAAISSTVSPYLASCYTNIIWSCLDSDLPKSAVFYAERYYALDHDNHDARHIYATSLLRAGQSHSALFFLRDERCMECSGCQQLKAQTCNALGRYRQAREALEESLKDLDYVPTPSMSSRTATAFPEQAVRRCLSGNMARKGHMFEHAITSYRHALSLHPYLWEAFEGLCALGAVPENIDEIFPPRALPSLPVDSEIGPSGSGPVATGAGFFTPDSGGPPLRGVKPDLRIHTLRLEPSTGSALSMDASFTQPEESFLQNMKPIRLQRSTASMTQFVGTRPLSSADESGPATKKLRSTSMRQRAVEAIKSSSSLPLATDERLKKARARPALTLANIFSSSGRRSQSAATSSRSNNKSNRDPPPNPGIHARRSSRLLSGPSHKPSKSLPRDRKRQPARTRSQSRESEKFEGLVPPGERAPSTIPQSPFPEDVPTKLRPEPSSQEIYEMELAEYTVYSTMQCCAKALRAFASYDLQTCIAELECLDPVHQRSPWVMALVGKAEYEKGDYSAAKRAFESLRDLEPYRIADMEVFSTLLWHTEKHVELSFLAQELLSIEPRSPQAWIAVGNCFSLQKDKKQALTCFARATQLDPTCAYAYTLSGHELVDNGIEQAVNFFQSAVRADPRHYNAWYGLGTCYLRMNKVRLAEYHYRKAAEIHPNNAILIGCIGLTKERSGDNEAAIQLYAKAIELCPENALVRYRRGKLLIGMKQYKLAVQDLEYLRDLSPDESNVVFQLARVYRLLGDKVKSAQLLAVARDVSPKSVKKIEKLLTLTKDEDVDAMDEG